MGADLKKVLSVNEKKAKTMACDTFCDKQLENDVWIIFSEIRKTLNPLWIKRFLCGGISRARTYDLHDVNVAL